MPCVNTLYSLQKNEMGLTSRYVSFLFQNFTRVKLEHLCGKIRGEQWHLFQFIRDFTVYIDLICTCAALEAEKKHIYTGAAGAGEGGEKYSPHLLYSEP